MCGIAGIVQFNGAPVASEHLSHMSTIMAHRGPDGEGIWLNEKKNVGFAHRRLAIIDLSDEANQPMHYNQRYTIVYNGEIYNYIEIKDKLIKSGYAFHTQSDTEVILAAFDQKGESCLQDFDGMFAFAIWDEKLQRLFIARDRFGEKPFHYFLDSNRFVFASEIKSIFKAGVSKKVSVQKVQNYLSHNTAIYNTETFFDGIQKLQHGHYAYITSNHIDIKPYYQLNYSKNGLIKADDQECALEFRRLFELSIRRRLRSDVPIATSFSGGLDSSGVVCMLHHLETNLNYKLFSARFDDPIKDEGKWMQYVTQRLPYLQINKLIEPNEILADIEQIVFHNEIPVGSTSVAAQYLLMKTVKQHDVKVILDGQGADEMLAGYGHYRFHYLNDLLLKGKIGNYLAERRAYHNHYHSALRIGPLQIAKMMASKLLFPKQDNNRYYQSFKSALFNDMTTNLQLLLTFADRNAMAHGVEARLPFLFHELVDFVFLLPSNQIYRNAVTKLVYRNAMKHIIPDEILNRKDKLGYAPPQEKWMSQFVIPPNSRLKNAGLTPSVHHWRNYITEIFLKVAEERF